MHNAVNEVKVISFGLLSGHRQTYELFKIYEKHMKKHNVKQYKNQMNECID